MASLKFACVVALMCMALVGAPMVQAITCGQVVNSLTPCIQYITKGGAPTPACCNGAKSILAAAKTTRDRQAACNCLKAAASSITGYNNANAAALPGKCGFSLPYTISPSTNCATIKF